MWKEIGKITNHLGSVITTLSDRRLAIQSAGSPTAVDYYFPNMLSTSDYYAFGMQQLERNYSSGYRYLFGGQEADNEVHNNVNNYTAEYWQYDARLGRRWENDPIVKPWESPYAAFANNPIWYVDPYGLDKQDPNNKHDDNGDGVSGPGEGCDVRKTG